MNPDDSATLEGSPAPSNPHAHSPLSVWIERRLSRREAIASLAAVAAGTGRARASSAPELPEADPTIDADLRVAPGHRARVLLRWGDPVVPGAPPFRPEALDPKAQVLQFGYNCDFIGFAPLPAGSDSPERGLLCVNHEYTSTELMFRGVTFANGASTMSAEATRVEMAAHGMSIVEIARSKEGWSPSKASKLSRRITADATEFRIAGPAAGHERMRTRRDPSGARVIGTLNNCSGGMTPWGTVLSGEENFPFYFSGDSRRTPEAVNHRRYGVTAERAKYAWWARFDDRFHVETEPHEPNRFGWLVEIDPYDPARTPVKRTALGRLRHEGACVVLHPDGRVVVYTGDDSPFEYLYRFVTSGKFDPRSRARNFDLLDEGTLFVARFAANGSLEWLPLVHGTGPLTSANGFESPADVLIETRRAADLVGATPLDRPEDVEASPVTGRVYVNLTNNPERSSPGPANPRGPNRQGHVLELLPPGREGRVDHAAREFGWDIFLLAGDPSKPADGARYGEGVSDRGWLAGPDNAGFDPKGRLWIATDEAEKIAGIANGVFVCETVGPRRAATRRIVSGPRGSEICSPCFTPDGTTLFVSVQHPGEEPGSNFDHPSTRWPDFNEDIPPRSSVVAITREDGGVMGG